MHYFARYIYGMQGFVLPNGHRQADAIGYHYEGHGGSLRANMYSTGAYLRVLKSQKIVLYSQKRCIRMQYNLSSLEQPQTVTALLRDWLHWRSEPQDAYLEHVLPAAPAAFVDGAE
jgi:hypothetical protein